MIDHWLPRNKSSKNHSIFHHIKTRFITAVSVFILSITLLFLRIIIIDCCSGILFPWTFPSFIFFIIIPVLQEIEYIPRTRTYCLELKICETKKIIIPKAPDRHGRHRLLLSTDQQKREKERCSGSYWWDARIACHEPVSRVPGFLGLLKREGKETLEHALFFNLFLIRVLSNPGIGKSRLNL